MPFALRISHILLVASIVGCDGTNGKDTDSSGDDTDIPPEPTRCDRIHDDIASVFEDCGIPLEEDPDTEIECTEELADLNDCLRDCTTEAPCGALDGTDIDAVIEFADCSAACVDPEEEAIVYAVGVTLQFAYNAEDDAIIVADTVGGSEVEPLAIFDMIDRDVLDGNDGLSCQMAISMLNYIERADWADGDILFGFKMEFTGESRLFGYDDCADVFGEAEVDRVIDFIITDDTWAFGFEREYEASMEDYFDVVDIEDDQAIGAGIYEGGGFEALGFGFALPMIDNTVDPDADYMTTTEMVTAEGLTSGFYTWVAPETVFLVP